MELVDTSIKKFPFLIYGRINVGTTEALFNYYLDRGYTYLLKNIVTRTAFFDIAGAVNSPIDIFIRQISRSRPLTTDYVMLDTISTPGNRGVSTIIANTDPNAPQGVNFTSTPAGLPTQIRGQINVDLLFANRDTISLKFARDGYNTNTIFNKTSDDFIDVVLFGYYLPAALLQEGRPQ